MNEQSIYAHAIARTCPTCHAPAGEPCNAPGLQTRRQRTLKRLHDAGNHADADRLEANEHHAHLVLHKTRCR